MLKRWYWLIAWKDYIREPWWLHICLHYQVRSSEIKQCHEQLWNLHVAFTHNWAICREWGDLELSVLNNIFIKLLHSRLKCLWARRDKKTVRTKGNGSFHGSNIFQTQQCGYTYKLIKTTAVCKGLHMFKSEKVPSLSQGSGHELPLLTENLFAIHTCSVFSSRMSLGI